MMDTSQIFLLDMFQDRVHDLVIKGKIIGSACNITYNGDYIIRLQNINSYNQPTVLISIPNIETNINVLVCTKSIQFSFIY